MERHFRESVLEALPARYDSLLQQIEDQQAGSAYDMGASLQVLTPERPEALLVGLRFTVPEPNLDGHVFCRVVEDKGDIEIDECVHCTPRALGQTKTSSLWRTTCSSFGTNPYDALWKRKACCWSRRHPLLDCTFWQPTTFALLNAPSAAPCRGPELQCTAGGCLKPLPHVPGDSKRTGLKARRPTPHTRVAVGVAIGAPTAADCSHAPLV